MKTFIEQVLNGEEFPEKINDYIDSWHNSSDEDLPLPTFLGMTSDEYALWVENPAFLNKILLNRKHGIKIEITDWNNIHLIAARSSDKVLSPEIIQWLKSKGYTE